MKVSQWISHKYAFVPGFAHVQTLHKIYAGERLNLSQFTISRKWKWKRNDGVMTKLSASDAAYSLRDKSPIWTVIVSQGDVSDFHHIQGVVGDLIAVRIQDVGVLLSPPPWKSPAELPTVFWQTPRSCGNLIAVRIHIPEFTRRNRFKIQCLIPVWALPNTVTLYFDIIYILFLKCWKVFKRTILHDCSTTATGSRKRRKAHKLSNGSLLWQQQVCNTILKCVL